MLLADLEQPGGTLTSPIKAPMSLLFPVALALFPIVLPAGFVGKKRNVACVKRPQECEHYHDRHTATD